MNETDQQPANPASRPVLTAVILHEEAEVCQHAKTVTHVITTWLDEPTNLVVKHWSFHQLDRLDVRAMASHQAEDATMLIVCSGHGGDLPESVTTWMARTYQTPHALKPVIIHLGSNRDKSMTFTQKLAAQWHVPLITDFSFGETLCWDQLRSFVEQRLSLLAQATEEEVAMGDNSSSDTRPKGHSSALSPKEQAIRDLAYRLWVAAGRPEGSSSKFWHQAEDQLSSHQSMVASPSLSQRNHNYENHSSTAALVGHPVLELLLKLPGNFFAGKTHALLQHLARLPQKRLTRHFGIRDMRMSPHLSQNT